jgi:hypothetical protein
LWRWARTPLSAEMIDIEFTRDGEVHERHEVPRLGWIAFTIVAERAGFDDAADFLVVVLGAVMAELSMSIEQALRFLMPSEAEMAAARYSTLETN